MTLDNEDIQAIAEAVINKLMDFRLPHDQAALEAAVEADIKGDRDALERYFKIYKKKGE